LLENNCMEKNIKICISGGHLTPALAVIDELIKVHPNWKIIFIGRTQEQGEIRKRNLQFFAITAGKLQRDISVQTIISFVKIPFGFVQSFLRILKERPSCILSFGGYISLPVGFAGWLLGVPVITHEQTHVLGLANRLMLPFVDYCLLSNKDPKYEDKEKFRFTGLPIRPEITHPSKTLSFLVPPRLPIIYVTGGSTGAVSMNEFIFPIISSLISRAVVIHQTGTLSIEKAKEIKQKLPKNIQSRYIPISYIPSVDVGWIMHHMSLIVGRSGGNTVAETAMVQKPAVFIPLPWSAQQEQEINAHWYEGIGNASIINQEKGTSKDLQKTIEKVLQGKSEKLIAKKILHNAAADIIQYIELLVAHDEQ